MYHSLVRTGLVAFLASSCVAQTILDVLPNNGAGALYNVLKNNPKHAQLVSDLTRGDVQYTLFAPSDEAMAAATATAAGNGLEDDSNRIRYHFLTNNRLMLAELNKETRLHNSSYVPATGKQHHVPYMLGTGPDGVWSFGNKSRVVHGDIQASNGVVHIIDRVLRVPGSAEWVLSQIPETVAFVQELKSLKMSLSTVSHATIFVPTRSALEALDSLVTDQTTRALAFQHLIINKSFSRRALQHIDNVVDDHGIVLNITHGGGAATSEADGVPVMISDQIYDDGIIHITNGIILRSGIRQHPYSVPVLNTQKAGASSLALNDGWVGTVVAIVVVVSCQLLGSF